jgi:hypothetical protein
MVFPVGFIVVSSCAPIAGPDQTNDPLRAMCVANEQDSIPDSPEQPPPQFERAAVRRIVEHQRTGIFERCTRQSKVHSVTADVVFFFGRVPFKLHAD